MTSQSDVDICSQALEQLGQDPIGSFEEGAAAATAGRAYPTAIRKLLGCYPWKFIRTNAQLDRTNEEPTAVWRYEFQLPGDLLAPGLYSIYRSKAQGSPPFKEYSVKENRRIWANEQELWIEYSRQAPESEFPPHVYALAIDVMTARLAKPITEDDDIAAYWNQKAYGVPSDNGAGGHMAQARLVDSQQSPPATVFEYSLIEARVGTGLPYYR